MSDSSYTNSKTHDPYGIYGPNGGLMVPKIGDTDPNSPYYHNPTIAIGRPSAYGVPIATRNALVQSLMDEAGGAGGLGSYTNSPYKGRMAQTLMALQQAAGQDARTSGGWSPQASKSLYTAQTQEQANPAMRGLALQEPGRLAGLEQTATKEYGLGGNLYADYLNAVSQLRNQDAANKQATMQRFGSIPIVGGLVAGLM